MGGTCIMLRGNEKYINNFGKETSIKEATWETKKWLEG
jgi:hypothetical protein